MLVKRAAGVHDTLKRFIYAYAYRNLGDTETIMQFKCTRCQLQTELPSLKATTFMVILCEGRVMLLPLHAAGPINCSSFRSEATTFQDLNLTIT